MPNLNDPAELDALFDSPRGRMVAAAALGASIFTMLDLMGAYADRQQRRRRGALAREHPVGVLEVAPSPRDDAAASVLHLDQECAHG